MELFVKIIIDAAFFLGIFFIFYIWYLVEKYKWKNTVGMFGGPELDSPHKAELKHIVTMKNFSWGFACLLAGWVALAVSTRILYLPFFLAAGAILAFILQAHQRVNKWAYFGLVITILAVIISILFMLSLISFI